LTQPVGIVNAGDLSNRLFIVEQPGKIRVWKDGGLLAAPFLDLGSSTGGLNLISGCTATSCGGERGLLGLAFHPNYEVNGFFYVYYTRSDGDIVIARYTVSADGDVADPASGGLVMRIEHSSQGNHNGGNLAFRLTDATPYLFIGTGDGGGGGDPDENGQNLSTLLGKLLRVDVDSDDFPADSERNYAIPADNPFVAGAGADEIWDFGFRNPWRWSFDSQTGGLYIGDVGQSAWEEVDFESPPPASSGGLNFGWDCREGGHDYTDPNGDLNVDCGSVSSVDPILEYDHSLGCSITGGFIYRGSTSASTMLGNYIFGDYCSGRIWKGTKSGPTWTSQQLFDTTFNVSSFGEDEDRRLYVADRLGGAVYRVAPHSFSDVLPETKTWIPIESLYFAQVSQGCGGGRYCGEDPVQRQQMAMLLVRAQEPFTPPAACSGSPFVDVDPEFCPWVQAAVSGGVAMKCDAPANRFCPTEPVTRGVMSKMLLRAVHGSGYSPAFPCGGTDAASDVTTSHPFCDWVNSALKENLMAQCDAGGEVFCVNAPVRRDQLAALLVGAFPDTIPEATP
jgi:glucose/arabinose dehydrogenase